MNRLIDTGWQPSRSAMAIVLLLLGVPPAHAATASIENEQALPAHTPIGLKPLDLQVAGPDFAEAAREQSGPLLSERNPNLLHLAPEQHGFDVHGGLEAGVMAGSHGRSGHYTAGHVDLSRGNINISLGVSEYGYHGFNRHR